MLDVGELQGPRTCRPCTSVWYWSLPSMRSTSQNFSKDACTLVHPRTSSCAPAAAPDQEVGVMLGCTYNVMAAIMCELKEQHRGEQSCSGIYLPVSCAGWQRNSCFLTTIFDLARSSYKLCHDSCEAAECARMSGPQGGTWRSRKVSLVVLRVYSTLMHFINLWNDPSNRFFMVPSTFVPCASAIAKSSHKGCISTVESEAWH